jgi:hypothetical protein
LVQIFTLRTLFTVTIAISMMGTRFGWPIVLNHFPKGRALTRNREVITPTHVYLGRSDINAVVGASTTCIPVAIESSYRLQPELID